MVQHNIAHSTNLVLKYTAQVPPRDYLLARIKSVTGTTFTRKEGEQIQKAAQDWWSTCIILLYFVMDDKHLSELITHSHDKINKVITALE